jgi:hypothetical protein
VHIAVVPGHFTKPELQVHPQPPPPQVAAPKFLPGSGTLRKGAGQALPHEPQFWTSDDKVLHAPEHPVCPDAQLRQALPAVLQPFTHDMAAGVTQAPALHVPCPRAPLESQVGPLPQLPVGKTQAPSLRPPQVPAHVPLPAQALREP